MENNITEYWQLQELKPDDKPEQFYLVWTPSGHNPTKQHLTEAEAKTEALRLLSKNPKQKYYVMCCVGAAETEINHKYKDFTF
jgi:hypothetical protein